MTSFGEKVRKLRKEQGWSQEDFADKIGIHGRHVGKYENDKVLPNAETLLRIADVFNVSLDYLLREEGASPASRIQDRDLLKNFEQLDRMEEKQRETVKDLIDAYIKKQQLEEMMASGDKKKTG